MESQRFTFWSAIVDQKVSKILKDGDGVHPSSGPAAARLDSATCSTELESQMKLTDVDNLQMMWQNRPLLPSLDSCLPMSPLDSAANAALSRCLLESASQYEAVLISGPAPLLSLVSPSEVLRESPQVASLFPGVSDMFIVSEHNGQEARLLRGCKAVPDNGGHLHPSDQLPSGVVLEEAAKEHLSRQAGLQNRAQGLQRRLQALLGERAVQHCTQQLEGLNRHCEPGGSDPLLLDCEPPLFSPDKSTTLSSLTEVCEFSLSSQSVLRGLQGALDSDATASSSSDEEEEEDVTTSPASERQWLEERAELGSGWSWLQLRLSELEGRIQQLAELHKDIRATKGGVVLAESQPLADNRIQQFLLRDMAGFPCRALDSDPDPCSPNRLLHNIERQSAQLSRLVNSLMPPLSLSPLSKQPHACNGEIAFTSCKRRTFGTRKLKARVCARTRPLVVYHKPKLFHLSAFTRSSQQDSGTLTPSLASSLLTPSCSSCSTCSACDPVVLCSDPDCSSSRALSSSSHPHPVPGHSLDTPLSHNFKRVRVREEWHQRPFFINVQPSGPTRRSRPSSTPSNGHKYKTYGGHCKSVMRRSPFEMEGSAQSQHRRASQRKRKRSSVQRLIEDKDDVLYQLCDTEDSSDEELKQSEMEETHKQATQGFVRKRQGVSGYNINSVVFPVSMAKVEKLQYKNILTPSWRLVETSALRHKEAESAEMEDLTDERFEKRHLVFELKEKLCSASWGKRKCCRRPKRSGSRFSASGGGTCTSGEESAMETCAQLDIDEQRSSKEWLPQTPWKLRRFPLDDDDEEEEEEALLSIFAPTISKNSISHLSPPGFCGATLSSVGQS
ncbi:KAT8 regulatory NSL complex subunit 1-like protein [Brachionichthys hirsutus]|uniref:KAT8 regulatory NSL complex subunit 1-like protein n=1 Tax=Brachionichthys hirsutus TaxID=412623 RepID=UPI00360543B8